MDKTWYIDECNRQLTDTKFYRRLNEDMTADIQKRVTVYVNRMHKDKLINDKTKLYLIQSDVKPGRFYILPKVHKPGNPGRPIVSSNSHPTESLPHFVDYHLQPLVHKLPFFVKDTNDFLKKLLTIGNLPANSLLVTLDVSSLFNNYSVSPRWIWSDKITNKRAARVGYNHFISNKGEWNNCFSTFSSWVLPPIFISTILQSENF